MKFETFHNGIKSVHIAAFDYEMHELYDAFSYSKHKLKVRTLTAAPDYEMHELYDAFSYSNNYFALNDFDSDFESDHLRVTPQVKPNFIQS